MSLKSAYRKEIDGLRGLAVLAVIINHFNQNLLPNGYLGVDIFFVISGFVITSSLANRQHKTLKSFLFEFYSRRIRRLVPALIFCIVCTGVAICLFDPLPRTSLKTGITALFGLSNLFLLHNATDYFAESSELNVFMHTWSLGVEEQFYFFFPWFIWVTGFTGVSPKGGKRLGILITVLFSASFLGYIILHHLKPEVSYFFTPVRLWEIAAGCLAFLIFNNTNKPYFFSQSKTLPSFLLIVIITIFLLPDRFAQVNTIAVVILTAFLIISIQPRGVAYKILTHRYIVFIGLISYSLYLWHWSVISISHWTTGIHWWSWPFQTLLIVLLALFSYYFIELPLRHSQWSSSNEKSIFYGVCALLCAACFCLVLWFFTREKIFLGSLEQAFWYQQGTTRSDTLDKTKCRVHTLKDIDIVFDRCHLKGSDEKIFFVGDSHALHFAHLAEKLNRLKRWSVVLAGVGGSSIPPISFTIPSRPGSHEENRQRQILSKALISRILQSAQLGDIVVLSSYYDLYLSIGNGYSAKIMNKQTPHYLDGEENLISLHNAKLLYVSNLKELRIKLQKKGVRLVLFAPTPTFDYFPEYIKGPSCMKFIFNALNPKLAACHVTVLRSTVEATITEFRGMIDLLNTTGVPALPIFDPTPILCQQRECGRSMQGNLLFYDHDHLTNYGAELIYPQLSKFLKEVKVPMELKSKRP